MAGRRSGMSYLALRQAAEAAAGFQVGVAVPKGSWDFDGYLGVWLFTDHGDFYPGGRARSQERVVALQGHTRYTFRPRLWAAVDATGYQGDGAYITGASRVSHPLLSIC